MDHRFLGRTQNNVLSILGLLSVVKYALMDVGDFWHWLVRWWASL